MRSLLTGWMLAYVLVGAGLIGLTGFSVMRGWVPFAPKPTQIAPNVRQSPGGWRSWTVWPVGFRGGK